MPVNIGLLPSAALSGLNEDQQGELQKQATMQFLLGTLLTGDPSMGYKGAMGLPEQAMSAQNRMLDLQEKERQRQEEAAFSAKYNPTKFQENSPEFAGPVSPDVAQQQSAIGAARAAGLPTSDVNAALRDLMTMRSPRQPQMLSAFQASLPKVGEGGNIMGPGAQYMGTAPQISPNNNLIYGVDMINGKPSPYSLPIPDAQKTRAALEGELTLARQLNTPVQVPGKTGAPTFIYPTPPKVGGAAGGGGVNLGNVNPPQTANDIALQKAAETRFGDFSKSVVSSAETANDRIAASQRMYDIAERVNGNKFTDLTAEGAAYMRGLPFVGDKFDQYVSDVKMFNVDKSKQVLAGLNNIKGNANGFEGAVVEKSASSITDPKAATKFIAALEIAAAEKDLAAQRFLESYNGPAGEARTQWSSSPQNPRIYNHPKVDQFLREQISANPAKPVLPAGFGLVQNKAGQYGVRKPDGSVMSLGQ
jgi:hypothetical protein